MKFLSLFALASGAIAAAVNANEPVTGARSVLQKRAGNFSRSCSNIGIEWSKQHNSYFLKADCTAINGNKNPTVLNLEECLHNDHGVVKWGGSGIGKSCTCWFAWNGNNPDIKCNCGYWTGGERKIWHSALNLNDRIMNRLGELVYDF